MFKLTRIPVLVVVVFVLAASAMVVVVGGNQDTAGQARPGCTPAP